MEVEEFNMPGGGKITRILSPDLANAIKQEKEKLLDRLVSALCNFDIWYMMSDDYGIWLHGRIKSDELNELLSNPKLNIDDRQQIFNSCLKLKKWSKSELSWLKNRLLP